MKNLNEPHERAVENITAQDIAVKPSIPSDGKLASFNRGLAVEEQSGQALITTKREVEDLRSRWNNIQASFVDEPRKAVEDADKLVASAIKQITEGFQQECMNLQKQWTQGGEVSTEDLRISLQHYRTFVDRLMSV